MSQHVHWPHICKLLRSDYLGLALYAVFPSLFRILAEYDSELFGAVATVYE